MPTAADYQGMIDARDAKIAEMKRAINAMLAVQAKTAEFVETAHGQLARADGEQQKMAAFRTRFCEESQKLAGLLEARALIPPARVHDLVEKLAENPMHIFDVCRQVAGQVPVPEFGEGVGVVTKRSEAELTGFERLALDANPALRARFGGGGDGTNLLDQT